MGNYLGNAKDAQQAQTDGLIRRPTSHQIAGLGWHGAAEALINVPLGDGQGEEQTVLCDHHTHAVGLESFAIIDHNIINDCEGSWRASQFEISMIR